MRRLVFLFAAAGFAAFVVAATGPRPSEAPIALAAHSSQLPQLGLDYGSRSSRLVRIDSNTLRARPGRRLDVGSHTFGWSFSGDGARLALAGDLDSLAIPSVLVVDTHTLRAVGRVRLAKSGWVRATAWLPGRRLVAVVSVFEGAGVHTEVVVADSADLKVLKRQALSGQVTRVARTRDGLVALLASTESLAPARLAIVEPGAAGIVRVGRILAGSERRSGEAGAEFSQRDPGLAVDQEGRRAFVIAASGDVAEVDLDTRAISYHGLSRPISFSGRLRAWLEPTGSAKSVEGPSRVARWLGGGLIAVTGGDYSVVGNGDRARFRFTPAGLTLVDTRSWAVRELGDGTDTVRQAGNLLLAETDVWSSALELPRPPGLVVYGSNGRERLRLYEGKRVWVVHADALRAYVRVDGKVDVVDLASGRVVERRESVPYPLFRPGAPSES